MFRFAFLPLFLLFDELSAGFFWYGSVFGGGTCGSAGVFSLGNGGRSGILTAGGAPATI